MPKFNKDTNEQTIKKNQKTNTGIYINAGEIESSDYDSKEWSELQADYYKMRNSDALLRTTIDLLKYPILMAEYKIDSLNKEVEDYCYWVLENIDKGFHNLKYHKLLALDYGLQMHEMIIKRGDKWQGKLTNRPVAFNPIQNETINKFLYDEQSIFTGIEHEKRTPDKASEFIEINKDDLHWFTYNEEFNDIRGKSLYRPIRLFWDSKHKLIPAKVIATQRGAGIPLIYTVGEPSSSDQSKIEMIGRTIGQLRNGYISANKEKIEVELLEPKGQNDIIPFLEYLDRQLFYNTLSQFVISGIGQNGSGAATGEHKSAYELMANYIQKQLEINIQGLVNKIINISCFANIVEEEMPIFSFNSISSVDLSKVAMNIKTLAESGMIIKTKEDEKFIREMFGMPENMIVTQPESEIEMTKLSKKKERKLSKEKMDFENRIFSLESANDHYMTMTEKIANAFNEVNKKIFGDIKEQLKKDKDKDIRIREIYIAEITENLIELYQQGYDKGNADVKSEIKKLGGKIKLSISKKDIKKKEKSIEKRVKKYITAVKNTIEIKMEKTTQKYIDEKGIDNIIDPLEEGFKGEKNKISKDIENGYIDGRGETLLELSDDIELYFYSTILDRNLCDNCAPFDGLILTKQEVENDANINFFHPVNTDCLGGDNCRCVLMPYQLRS